MADFYVCKYAHKYVSELIYAFKRLQDLKSRRDIKVLSFGCGPCTDVLALDYLRQSGTYCFETLEYRGIDYGKEVWKNIHANLKDARSAGLEINYYYNDACKLIEQISAGQWVPNLVVFQYFFSDIKKNAQASEISSFIREFSQYANSKMPVGSYIVLNDINLSIDYDGGREYFDIMKNQINFSRYDSGHFRNNLRSAFSYGSEFEDNVLLFDVSAFDIYHPFESCSSAQMILKKG